MALLQTLWYSRPGVTSEICPLKIASQVILRQVFLFFKINFYWSIVALPHCVLFYHTKASQLVAVVHSLSLDWFFLTPWTAAHKTSLSFTIFQSLLKPMSIESVMLSNNLVFCQPLLLLPSIFSSIRVFSNESAHHIRWPKYWSFSFSVSPFNEYSELISFRIAWYTYHISSLFWISFSLRSPQSSE